MVPASRSGRVAVALVEPGMVSAGLGSLALGGGFPGTWSVQPVVDEYLKDTASKNLPGKEVIEYVEKRLADAKKGEFKSKYMDSGQE